MIDFWSDRIQGAPAAIRPGPLWTPLGMAMTRMTLQEWIWELPGVDFVTFFEVLDRAETYLDSQNTVFAAPQPFCKKTSPFSLPDLPSERFVMKKSLFLTPKRSTGSIA